MDTEALDQFFRQYERLLCIFAYRILRDWDLAADAVCAAIEDLLLYYDTVRSYPNDRKLRYLTAIVRHECYAILQEEEKNRTLPGGEAADDAEEPNPILAFQDKHALRAAINQLPERYRTAVLMKYYFNAEDELIARHLGVQVSSVRMILTRARRRLGKGYQSELGKEG